MALNFKEFTTSTGELLLYLGSPDLGQLEALSLGCGDVWHSSLDQGFKNIFPEIVYQTATFWYVNDIENVSSCVNWRISPYQFVVRKKVWDFYGGFENCYQSDVMKALDFGYNSLCYRGVVPLYVKGLFAGHDGVEGQELTLYDQFAFYFKNFKKSHAAYVLYRKGFWKPSVLRAYLAARKSVSLKSAERLYPPRALKELIGKPKVSYLIPTMLRQEFTMNLLQDLVAQSYRELEVIVIDATPEEQRDYSLYAAADYPFEVRFVWQESKGSCRARNEAIALCTGDYIIFGDDDIRIPSHFVADHVRLLQTYGAAACNGLDLRADHENQDLNDLELKLKAVNERRWRVGVTTSFSNANSCVKADYVHQLIGNDINYDGGYGEDSDFGISLAKLGVVVLHNPFSANLHLKPAVGGYRFWGLQAQIIGKKRTVQPWELDVPVKLIRPVPSPTIVYQVLKQFGTSQFVEYKHKYFMLYLLRGSSWKLPLRLLKLPYRMLQFNTSVFYAMQLIKLGKRTK